MSNQSKKAAHPVLRSIGIIVLILLLLISGGILLIVTDRVSIDDPAALAAQAPMPAAQRFAFDAAKETVQISLDKSDLWWLLLPEMEDSILEDVNRKLENYDLSVTGYGFDITEDGVYIDLEAMYRFIRLPVHILTSLDFDASGFSMTLSKVELGPFRLPVEMLLSSVDVRLDVDWPVASDITNVDYRKETVLLTGTLTQELFSCVQEACKNDAIGWFSTSHQEVFRAARMADGFRELIPGLEQDPGSIEALYRDMFTMALVYEYEDYMEQTRNLSHRFFPGIDFDAWETESNAVRSQWVFCDVMMDKMVEQVSNDFNNRRFRLKDGAFYLRNSEFDALHYFDSDTAMKIEQLFHVIDQDKFLLVLVDSADGYAAKSPVLNGICAWNQELTQELNRNKAYPVACVFQGKNGAYCLRYESVEISENGSQGTKAFKTVILTEAEYDSLIQEGKIGVWVE